MTRKPRTIAFWQGRLPHWEVEDGRYFITIHLRGAIPAAGRERLRSIVDSLAKLADNHGPDWLQLQRAIFREMEHWLDQARWAPHFGKREVAEMVVEAVEHRARRREWDVFEFVVMPTHIHLFCEVSDRGLKGTLEDFKRWTGHRAVALLPEFDADRFWQREWFDHWSRSDEEDERIVAYIRNNPVKAGLVTSWAEYPYRLRK